MIFPLVRCRPFHHVLFMLIVSIALVGCGGGGSDSGNASVEPNTEPGPKPVPEKPTTTPKIVKNKPKPIATKSKPVDESTLTEFVMLEPQAYKLEVDPTFNQVTLGPADVDANQYLLIGSDGSSGRGTRSGTPWTPDGLEPSANTKVSPDGTAFSAISTKDDAPMELIPAGQYRQGSTSGPASEMPEHTSFVSAFYIDAHEVTVGQFLLFMDDVRGSELGAKPPVNEFDDEDYPALGISYRDAQSYATWAGKSLPTESQWERAARGDNSLPNVWGRGRALWSQPRRPGQITAVAKYRNDRSIFGVFDLAGNAREWCRDFWDATVYEEAASEPGGVARDWDGPRRPKRRNERTVRGTLNSWSVTARAGLSTAQRDPKVGFRCVVEFDPEQ